jgi:membrane fusion protein, multidrug efflux system
MIKKWMLTLLACVVIASVLVAYKIMHIRAAEQAKASAPEYSETVEAASVEVIDYQPEVSVLGEVVSPQQIALRNEVAGTIAAVNFSAGTVVEEGQLLIQLEASEERAQLQSAIASVELARISQKRLAKLRTEKIASEDQYDNAVAELKVAQAKQAMLEATLSKKTVRAPFAGIAGLHQFERGQYLEENTLITTLVGQQDFVWVDFSLPQNYRALPRDARVTIEELSSAHLSSPQNADLISAPVIARESIMTRDSRSLNYRAQVPRTLAGTGLLSNAMVRVKVPIAAPQSNIAIPAVAVLHSSAGAYVYVLNADADADAERQDNSSVSYRAARQPVVLGERQGQMIIVVSGLEAGQRVASAGAFKLSPGLLTFVTEPVMQDVP